MGPRDLGPTRVFLRGDPMHEDEDQFTTFEEQVVQQAGHKRWYPTPTPTTLEEPVRPKLPPLGQIIRIQNPPAGWKGNYKREHNPEAEPCMCYRCYLVAYPYLIEGPPVQVHPQYPVEAPAMQQMVGLYDPKEKAGE